MTGRSPYRVAVIGAGIAGSAATRPLTQRGARVTVFDKGRGVGGRCATRRKDALTFDHGAQYFTVRDPLFRRQVDAWATAGAVARWRPRYARIDSAGCTAQERNDLWVGMPKMTALTHNLLTDIDTRLQQRVVNLKPTTSGWCLHTATETRPELFDQVLVTVPAPQLGALLGEAFPQAVDTANQTTMLPCWTLMLALNEPLALPFDAARIQNDGPLGWVARNNSKPGRQAGSADCWVVQANHPWSQAFVELPPEEAAKNLLQAFKTLVKDHASAGTSRDALSDPIDQSVHRWRYALAQPTEPTPTFLLDADTGLAVAGDWLLGGKIEAAWRSGHAAGEALSAAWTRMNP